MNTTDWLPSVIGLGVGLGQGALVLNTKASPHANLYQGLYRGAIFGVGLIRELRAQPGESTVTMDVNYGLMTAAGALEGIEIGNVVNGGTPKNLGGMVAHAKGCSTCASRRPVVAAPLLTPAASLSGYPHSH